MKVILTVMLLSSLVPILFAQTKYPDINKEISLGNYAKAESAISKIIETDTLSAEEKYSLNFQIDRMERIKLDFDKTEADIIPSIKKYYPNVDEKMIDNWVTDNSLEAKIIDGKRWFFQNAVPNLFRINKQAKARKEGVDGKTVSTLDAFLSKDIPAVVKASEETGKRLVNPIKIKINYTLTVKKDVVPAGEVIRCWLPYPREGHKRQTDIKLLSVNSDLPTGQAGHYIISPNDDYLQRTLYMQKKAKAGEPTVFNYSLEYTAYAEWYNLKPDEVKPYDKNSEIYKTYTAERPPHIVFTDKIKKLSQQIIGSESNPYKKVKLIFKWISDNIPWASAREYSTIKNISDYCLTNMHGDCGIKGLLFITLCRYNGIPARWQSGWMMHPGNVNLHDWTEVYYEGIGWVPCDPYMGVRNSDDPKVQYFFTDGIDAYHFIVNDNYGQPLYPAKIYPRSETVDFQRGEVEWKGGNLYFNKWNYHMDVKYLPVRQAGLNADSAQSAGSN
jgi:transglutaminase-like putative cysteine protease